MVYFNDPIGETFVANMARIGNSNAAIQRQISSGLKVGIPEDAPDQVTQLLQLQASLAHNTDIQTGLNSAQASATAADQALTQVLTLVDQASSLGAEGLGAATSATTRQQLAQQVQGIFDQVVSLSQTQNGGTYIFGGDANTSPSYRLDPSQPNGVDVLSTALNTSVVQDPNGGTFPAGLTAGQIFDHRNPDGTLAPDNLFGAVNALYVGLNNNDSNAIAGALTSIQQASAYVNTQQSFYGALQNRVTAALSTASALNVSLTQQISSIRDTDLSQAAVQLTQGETQQQAALAAQSKVPKTSLFDFLG